jgi:precorrin-2 dehydrogenase/sirohydrochlorin ferrochelatase
MFPLVADLTGRRVLVIGAGRVGIYKATQLLEAGAKVTIISDHALDTLPEGIEEFIERRYIYGDLDGMLLVVSATGDPRVNDEIIAEARERNVLINCVDDLSRSNFYFTANYRDGDVIVAVSTSGASPALAQWVRAQVAASMPDNLAKVADQLRLERAQFHEKGESTENRPWAQRVLQLIEEL